VSDRVRINLLLEDTALYGGVKVVLHHARLLRELGHRVEVVSRGPRPDWYPTVEGFRSVSAFHDETVPPADLHIATFWTTVAPAAALSTGRPVHFCQGFEAALDHNRDVHPQILDAYALEMPTWTVSPHLAAMLGERFGRRAMVVPPALEGFWRPSVRDTPGQPPRVLVPHPFEFYMKGVDVALRAVLVLRERGLEVRLVRLSQWPLSDAERHLVEPDEFHHHLTPPAVADLVAGCDLVLAPSWPSEGFGLAVLEAMACGTPVIASRTPSHEGFAADAALLVPHDAVDAFADAAEAVLRDPQRWVGMRRAGLDAAGRFVEQRVAGRLESAVRWAAGDDWRTV
jgi:glycosyltransferase involved in cell wall biosynthesis